VAAAVDGASGRYFIAWATNGAIRTRILTNHGKLGAAGIRIAVPRASTGLVAGALGLLHDESTKQFLLGWQETFDVGGRTTQINEKFVRLSAKGDRATAKGLAPNRSTRPYFLSRFAQPPADLSGGSGRYLTAWLARRESPARQVVFAQPLTWLHASSH
jgi:hypothetical protein